MARPLTAAQLATLDLMHVRRRRDSTPQQEAQARAELAAASLAAWIERKLAEAPPLSPDQLARLRALLVPAGAGDGTGT